MSWASLDSPEESPDRSLSYQECRMKEEAREIIDQVNCMQNEILSLKNESSNIMSDIKDFSQENMLLNEKQKTLTEHIKFTSEGVLSKIKNEDEAEIELLKRKISDLEANLKDVEERYQTKNKDLREKNR